MGFILVSGVMISKTILVGVFKASNVQVFQSLHIAVSYVSLLLIGIHVGLNWCWVMNRFKQVVGFSGKSRVFGKLGIVVVVLVLCFGCYTIYSENYLSKVSMVQGNVRGTQGAGGLREGVNRPTKGGGDARGQFLGGTNGERAFAGGHGGNGSANVFTVLITHLGIISAFSVMTFYVLKLGNRKKSGISIT
ncbi:MAG TPA: DUF4405 domain-containing protein [Desulfosporosinus sp.]|nr:DUF4405 domain-containing protein [Desulfosporosinus sp.]